MTARMLLLLLMLLLPFSAQAASFNVFGDSLSDPGNVFALTGGTIPPEPYWEGRFSNGPVWADRAATRLGLPTNNFALGGAQTGRTNVNGELGGVLDQIDEYVGLGPADPDGIHVIWAGGNNFLSSPEDPVAAIGEAVMDLGVAVGTLQAAGATDIILFTLPDLGATPRINGDPELSAGATQLTVAFNTALGQLEGPGVRIFDVFAQFADAISNPGSILSNATDACLVGGVVCESPSDHVFWDDIHPTTTSHAILADAFVDYVNAVPEPAALVLMPLVLGAAVALRRRSV